MKNAAEIWKAIPGYEGRYEASSLGRIRSVKRKIVIVREYGGDCGKLRLSCMTSSDATWGSVIP